MSLSICAQVQDFANRMNR